jgi:hypothetical protein
MFKSLLMVVSSLLFAACNPGSGGRGGTNSGIANSGTAPTGSAPTQSSLPEGVSRDKVKLTFDAFSVTPTVFVKSTAENVCLPFKLNVASEDKPLEGATVAFTISPLTAMRDQGELLAISTKSSAAGVVEGMYCSGESEGQLVIAAELSGIITNSETIRVTIKPVYKLAFLRSDADPLLSPTDTEADDEAIYLNLVDSGPQDCTTAYFKLTKSDKAVPAAKVNFRSQIDFPAGAKFAKKADPASTSIDPTTNRKYLSYESFTNGSGEVAVPVCAGVFLGSLDVAASYVDEESKRYETHSPVVRIVGGLTNWINMSLMFDEMNGRTLRGYFNTNSKYKLPITANVGSRMDGMPIRQYPMMVAAETGRVTMEDGGSIDPETGTVKFTVQALHLVDNYPYQVYPFEDVTQAQTRCHPAKIADWGLANTKPYVNYSDIAKNWRSTLVYYTRGQEHYNDANSNGRYDEGGDGFWDRNQNGYYDADDVLTYDAGNDGKLDRRGEWFIDLPTPFIDVDEDKVFNANTDILIGEKYEAPNGKRDADTTDWKYEVLPISMGPSFYSLQHYRIDTSDYRLTPAVAALPWGSYNIFGVDAKLEAADFWNAVVNYSDSSFWNFAVYAHDVCGSLLTGGTKFELWLEETVNDGDVDITYSRYPAISFVSPPEDHYLEPNRRLFTQRDTEKRINGSSPTTAYLNFNAIDHPSKDYGYPVMGQVVIPQCNRPCTGAVNPADPGHFCLGWSGHVKLQITEPELVPGSMTDVSSTTLSTYIEIPRINACKCVAGSTQSTSGASCACNGATVFNAATLTCN